MGNGQVDLVEALVARFEGKADPTGETFQRLAYYLVQSLEKHMDYLTQESFKICKPAFLALYQFFPYGRFPHFLAISEILNSVPHDAEVIYSWTLTLAKACDGLRRLSHSERGNTDA